MKGRITAILLLVPVLAMSTPERADDIDRAVTRGEWKTAINLAEAWVDAAPDDALAHYWLALAFRTKMQEVNRIRAMGSVGDYKRALARSIELDPNLVSARAERIGYLIHAPGIAGGDRDEAAREIEALEALDPRAAAQMAVELARVEEDQEALVAAINKLVALEPEQPSQALQTALVLIGEARYEEAEERLSSLADSEEPGVALGSLYQRARWRILAEQDTETAAAFLEDYLARRGDDEVPWSPNRAAAYWRLGLAQELNGDLEAALASLEESVALNPGLDEAKKDLRRLKRGQ